jgi:hypothetical protein
LHHPVTTADNEAGVFAERAARINVPAAGVRKHRAEFSDGERAAESVDAAEEPREKDKPPRMKFRRDLTRRAQNSGADRVADADGHAKGHSENPKQMAFRAW